MENNEALGFIACTRVEGCSQDPQKQDNHSYEGVPSILKSVFFGRETLNKNIDFPMYKENLFLS